MSSEDEVDYMSDSFLESICGKEDIRPGLIKSHSQQYDHMKAANKIKTDHKNKVHNPSMKVKQAASREDGLSKPLDNDNLGFKMLQKLGFKPGTGLGKSGEGRVEPISIEIKSDRQGLGRKSSLEEISRLRSRYKAEAREKLLNVNDYRARKAQQASERSATTDLVKSQRVCWELDSKECIEVPAEAWFWPMQKVPTAIVDSEDDVENEGSQQPCSNSEDRIDCEEDKAEDEENYFEDEEFSVTEKLEMLTLYLRRTYLYCVWCGHCFDDERDLQQDCPGPTREDH